MDGINDTKMFEVFNLVFGTVGEIDENSADLFFNLRVNIGFLVLCHVWVKEGIFALTLIEELDKPWDDA